MYVFQLKFEQIKTLSGILDVANDWEKLAGLMGFSSEEVYAFRQAPARGASPTAEILRAWGSRGYKVNQLFELLMAIQQRRAMHALLPFADKKYKAIFDKGSKKREDDQTAGVSSAADGNDMVDDDASHFARAISLLPSSPPPAANAPAPMPPAPTPPRIDHHRIRVEIPARHDPPAGPSAAAAAAVASASSAAATVSEADSAIATSLLSTLSIPYAELAEATGQFSPSNVLGRGGYGVVFRGCWKHTKIAVKLIGGGRRQQHRRAPGSDNSSAEKERLRQSLMELKTLSLYRHDNILPLYAYSLDGPAPCLVYQYMANGSLEDRLLCRNGTSPLEWKQRHKIAIDASRGLHFLHSCAQEPLIHGDIKSANILLDSHYDAKIGDFGLSRRGVVEIPNSTSPLIASHIKGTLAYLPPEFLRRKHLSTKLDVYSFGVVLFEIATGLRAYSDTRKPENLVEFVHSQTSGENVRTRQAWALFVDCKLDVDGADRLVPICVEAGLKCTTADPSARPSMKEVLESLDAA